ncbi:MAG: response regulator transcription factor [Kiritimatiellae bacterium]|jgi:DNA-binding response OmpR family regulator|nr:response regulator transcription factor [Kiritimatiellia bacterium]
MSKILVAEDNKSIREGLIDALEAEGYDVCSASNGAEALEVYKYEKPDLLILDVMMPRKSGYDVCNTIRKTDTHVPIIFLTAKSSEQDKMLGFGLGGDDYVTKPFSLGELLARVHAIFRRVLTIDTGVTDKRNFMIGTHEIDPVKFTVKNSKGVVDFIKLREMALMKYFYENPNTVISRDDLMKDVWGLSYVGTTRTVDQHIAIVRKLLEEDGVLIETVQRVGYFYRKYEYV